MGVMEVCTLHNFVGEFVLADLGGLLQLVVLYNPFEGFGENRVRGWEE